MQYVQWYWWCASCAGGELRAGEVRCVVTAAVQQQCSSSEVYLAVRFGNSATKS